MSEVNTVAFIQARMSSTRLPNKVLREILGESILNHLVSRLKNSKTIDKIVVLTSQEASDDAIEVECSQYGYECFRGSLNNVLERFYLASKIYDPKNIVRITADCPLLDWNIVDDIVTKHLEFNADYTSNTIKPTYPDGLDVEVFSLDCLHRMYHKAHKDIEKEHVTYYCYTHPDEFEIKNVENPLGDMSNYRWTVDTEEDFLLVSLVYKNLYTENKKFLSSDIYDLFNRKKDLLKLNNQYERNEGLMKEDNKC